MGSLPDGYEVFELDSDPLVNDSNRDEDKDGLTNLEEYKLGTSATDWDTDVDGLSDYEEVKQYKTNPLKEDTDGDTLEDGDDVLFGFDPLKPDTDGNGILDGDEKTEQIFLQEFEKDESEIIKSISIKGKFSKNVAKTTQIDNYYGSDVQTTDVVGLIGIPVNIETESKFDQLDIIFEYETLPSGIKEDNIGVLWYNEKEETYELQDCVLDKTKNIVTFSTTHLSTYMLVDRNQWKKIWNTNIKYGTTKDEKELGESIQVVKNSKSKKSLQSKYNILSKELKESCKFIIKSNSNSKFASNMCQTPMFFMNQLAIVLSGDWVDAGKFVVIDFAERYESAKWTLIEKRDSIKHPHFADAYIILSE